MQLYPKDIKDKLEFNKIIDYISAECLSDMGRDYFAQIEILTDLVRIERLIDETDEYKKAIERG